MLLGNPASARRADKMHVGFTFFPERFVNDRFNERISPDKAPDPVRDSDVVNIGRVGTFPAQQQITLTEDIDRWAEWEEDKFRGSHFKMFFRNLVNRAVVGSRGQGTWADRHNFERVPPDAMGSTFIIPQNAATVPADDGYYFPGGG